MTVVVRACPENSYRTSTGFPYVNEGLKLAGGLGNKEGMGYERKEILKTVDRDIKPFFQRHSSKMLSCKFFLQGLPFDVKAREIYNLAMRFDGCVRSCLEFCNGAPVGVLEFTNVELARQAAMALHNYPFDRDNQQFITVNFPNYGGYPGPNVLEYNMQRMWGGQQHQGTHGQHGPIAPAHEKRKIIIKNLQSGFDKVRRLDTQTIQHTVSPSMNCYLQPTILFVCSAGGSARHFSKAQRLQDDQICSQGESTHFRRVRIFSGRVRCC